MYFACSYFFGAFYITELLNSSHNADYVTCGRFSIFRLAVDTKWAGSNPEKSIEKEGISMEKEYATLRDDILKLMQKREKSIEN